MMDAAPCRYKGAGVQVRHYEYLHHNHAGVVSLSEDASEVVVTLTKAIYLDSSYQVKPSPCHNTMSLGSRTNELMHDVHTSAACQLLSRLNTYYVQLYPAELLISRRVTRIVMEWLAGGWKSAQRIGHPAQAQRSSSRSR